MFLPYTICDTAAVRSIFIIAHIFEVESFLILFQCTESHLHEVITQRANHELECRQRS
jgi:hypothetical protein